MNIEFKLNEILPHFHYLVAGKGFKYDVLYANEIIGEITLFIEQDSAFIDYLQINEEFSCKGLGSLVLNKLFTHFEKINSFHGIATEDVLNGFWAKQKGFQYNGECSDGFEDYRSFFFERPIDDVV